MRFCFQGILWLRDIQRLRVCLEETRRHLRRRRYHFCNHWIEVLWYIPVMESHRDWVNISKRRSVIRPIVAYYACNKMHYSIAFFLLILYTHFKASVYILFSINLKTNGNKTDSLCFSRDYSPFIKQRGRVFRPFVKITLVRITLFREELLSERKIRERKI